MGCEQSCQHSIFPPEKLDELKLVKKNKLKEIFLEALDKQFRTNPYMRSLLLMSKDTSASWTTSPTPVDSEFCKACQDVAEELKVLGYKVKSYSAENKKLDSSDNPYKDTCEILFSIE